MRRILAEKFVIEPIYHCPISLCGHVERTKELIIDHLIKKHTDQDAWDEKKEDAV